MPKIDIHINDYTLKRNHICIASSTPATMDPAFWCKEEGFRPVDEFWPGRFLKQNPETGDLEFSIAGMEGHWVPFGGGPHACPGRIFAKRQAILALALMVTMYDCEVLAGEKELAMDQTSPFGTIPPSGKIKARIRRRDVGMQEQLS
jgi:cytochrome P450